MIRNLKIEKLNKFQNNFILKNKKEKFIDNYLTMKIKIYPKCSKNL